jgi:tetratricopeptide (TPR) repeat protein
VKNLREEEWGKKEAEAIMGEDCVNVLLLGTRLGEEAGYVAGSQYPELGGISVTLVFLSRDLLAPSSTSVGPMTMHKNGNNRFLKIRSVIRWLLCGVLVATALVVPSARADGSQAQIELLHVPELDAGFHLLYELKFAEALAQFEAWQKFHPNDPRGSASEAAAYLFEECYRQGVLTSEFFLDDKRFLGKIPLKPDPALRAAFFAADKRAQSLAQLRLKTNPDDPNALFAMTLGLGMQADYASLIDKQQVESLKMIGDADQYAKKLLAVAPDAADAYLTLGTANYIIGSLPALKRLFIGFAGIHGDKRVGIKQLAIAATGGHYLRPFAKIMLALAALREKKTEVARAELRELVAEFPANPLFASELAKLDVSSCRDGILAKQIVRQYPAHRVLYYLARQRTERS